MAADDFKEEFGETIDSVVGQSAILVQEFDQIFDKVLVNRNLSEDVAEALSRELSHKSVLVLQKFNVDCKD